MNMKKTIAGVMSGAMAVSAMASVVSATEISANNTTEPNSREQIVLSYDLCEYTEKFSDSVVILTTTYEEIPGGYEFTLGKHQIGAKLNEIASYDIVSTQIDATNMDGKASKKLYYSIANNGGAIKDLTNESVAEEDVKDEAVNMLTDDKGNDYAFDINFAKRDAATNLRGEFIVDNFNVASSRYKDAMGMTKEAAEAKYAQLIAGETEAVSKPNGNTSAAVKPEALKKEKIEHDYQVFGYKVGTKEVETETTTPGSAEVKATTILKYVLNDSEDAFDVTDTEDVTLSITVPRMVEDTEPGKETEYVGAVYLYTPDSAGTYYWYAGMDDDGNARAVQSNDINTIPAGAQLVAVKNDISTDDAKNQITMAAAALEAPETNNIPKNSEKLVTAGDGAQIAAFKETVANALGTQAANSISAKCAIAAATVADPSTTTLVQDTDDDGNPIFDTYYYTGAIASLNKKEAVSIETDADGVVVAGKFVPDHDKDDVYKYTDFVNGFIDSDGVEYLPTVLDITAKDLHDFVSDVQALSNIQTVTIANIDVTVVDEVDADVFETPNTVYYYNGTNNTVTLDSKKAKAVPTDLKVKTGDRIKYALLDEEDDLYKALSDFANALEQVDDNRVPNDLKLNDPRIIIEAVSDYKAKVDDKTDKNKETVDDLSYGIFTIESVEKYKVSVANNNADGGLLEPLSYLDEKGNDQFKFKTYTLKSTFYVHNVAGKNSKYTGKTTYYTIINTLTKDAGSTVVNYTEGAAYEEIRPMKSALNAPADVFKAISTRKAGYHYYTYPKAVINDVISNNEDVTFTFTSSQYWVDTRKTLEINYPQYVYYPATSTCNVTYKGLQGYNAHLKGIKCTVSGTPNAEGSKVIIDNPEYGMARATNPNNDKWWYSPYFAQHLYQNSAFPTNHGYNAYGPIFADANDAYSVYGSYNYGNWNSNLFNGGLVINSNWTMQLSDTDAFEWGDSSITFFWNKIKNEYLSGNAKVTNASQFIETMLLYTPVEWYWDKLDVAVGAAIAEGVDSGAGQEDDGEAVEEEPEEVVEEVIEEEPEEEVFEEYVEEEPEEEYVEEEPEEEEEEEIEEEEEPEEEEEEVEEEPAEEAPAAVESPKTGNAPIALAVIPVALAAAAVIAKKKN